MSLNVINNEKYCHKSIGFVIGLAILFNISNVVGIGNNLLPKYCYWYRVFDNSFHEYRYRTANVLYALLYYRNSQIRL